MLPSPCEREDVGRKTKGNEQLALAEHNKQGMIKRNLKGTMKQLMMINASERTDDWGSNN